MANRGYKRSWKNLLINKRYQLSFTLLMVGLATLLLVGLGIFVMHVATETTEVSQTSQSGRVCPPIPTVEAPYEETAPPPMKLPEPEPEPTGERRHPKINVTLDEMELPKPVVVVPPVPKDLGQAVIDHWTCQLEVANALANLERGKARILYVLIGFGVLLVFGLAAYGIKMTHRVAGPLFKVQLYLAKMRDGRYDKVYDLRKGDQLVEFYEHFKRAHAGVVKLQQEDLARLRAVIAAAEAANAADHPAIAELRELVARKEKSLE